MRCRNPLFEDLRKTTGPCGELYDFYDTETSLKKVRGNIRAYS